MESQSSLNQLEKLEHFITIGFAYLQVVVVFQVKGVGGADIGLNAFLVYSKATVNS